MLIRALLISVFLHLVSLLSAGRLDVFALPAASGRAVSALEMRIGSRDMHELASPKMSIQGVPKVKPEMTVRKSGVASEVKTADLNIGRFFRSTVEGANSGNAEFDRAHGIESSKPQSTTVEELGQYRLNVARSARQFKVYPSLARDNGWEGVVHVSVVMAIGMGNPTVSLDRSSGHGVLDQQALEMVEQAVSLAVMPEGMRGRNLSISLPVEYRLAD
ncbi:MAG: energy transducer TonB [Azonexus sp.]